MHPGVFASVDGDGYVDVWDICKDMDSPISHKNAFEGQNIKSYRDFDGQRQLSCLKWARDGKRLALGDSEGYVSIWSAARELYTPRQSDFDAIDELI